MLFFRYTNYKIVINLSRVVQYNKNDIKEDVTKLYKTMKYFKIPPSYANQLICLCLGDCKLIYYIICNIINV
jgi:hypothetical protein